MVNRYKTGSDVWYQSFYNAPKKPAKRISRDNEKTIVYIRKTLKEQKYVQRCL